jgi:hypothetical protein
MVGVAWPLGARRVEQGIGLWRRFDEGGPTAHRTAGGRPPRHPGPWVPRRQSTAGRTDVARREP